MCSPRRNRAQPRWQHSEKELRSIPENWKFFGCWCRDWPTSRSRPAWSIPRARSTIRCSCYSARRSANPKPVGDAAQSTLVMAATPCAGWRSLPRKKNRLCAVQPGHFRWGALCRDSRFEIHFADRGRLLPLHDQNRAVIGLRPAMGLEPCPAEERQRRGHGKLRLASVLLDALLESSQKALPILTIAVHHTTSLHSHGRPGQRETQNVGIQVPP